MKSPLPGLSKWSSEPGAYPNCIKDPHKNNSYTMQRSIAVFTKMRLTCMARLLLTEPFYTAAITHGIDPLYLSLRPWPQTNYLCSMATTLLAALLETALQYEPYLIGSVELVELLRRPEGHDAAVRRTRKRPELACFQMTQYQQPAVP